MQTNSGKNVLVYVLQTALAAIIVLCVLSWQTNGFANYTYESNRQARIQTKPVQLSDWNLESDEGEVLRLTDFSDKTLLVDFIFTRCPTICQSLGTRYQQLQKLITNKKITDVFLLSISIDPKFDTAQRLRGYRTLHKGTSDSWILARPTNHQQLRSILNETGVRVIPDQLYGFSHSDSIHVIKHGQLTAIYDWNSEKLDELLGVFKRSGLDNGV